MIKAQVISKSSLLKTLINTSNVLSSRQLDTTAAVDTTFNGQQLPTEAKVVIYGNDLTAASIAYHLSEAQNFGHNCIVITGNKSFDSTIGTAVGQPTVNTCLLSHMNVANPRVSQLIQYSKQLFDVNQCGALYLAHNKLTIDSFGRRISSAKIVSTVADNQQANQLLTKDEIIRRYGHVLNCDDFLGGMYVPNDSIIEDIDGQQRRLCQLAADNGVKFYDNVLLNKININSNRISNVEIIDYKTNRVKRIDCQYFINSANNYLTRLIAKRCPIRVRIPTLCVHNQVMITKPFDIPSGDSNSLSNYMPIVHDFDQRFTVYQTSDGSVHLTGYERVAKILQKILSENDRTGGMNVEIPLIRENWDDFYRILRPILDTIPALNSAKLHKLIARLENFTPDGRSLIGEVPEVGNYLLAAGVVPQLAAGAGRLITDIVTKSGNSFGHDFWSLDPRRFISSQSNRIFLFDRLREVPAKARYNINFPSPHNDYETGHGLKTCLLYPRFKQSGALFQQIMGYERPAVYLPDPNNLDIDDYMSDKSDSETSANAVQLKHKYLETKSFGRPNWLDAVREEYQACRERVALLDYCSFTKLELKSTNDEVVELLQYLCSNDIDVNVGSIVHTGMQNDRGGYENDVSLIRMDDNQYMLVGPSEQQSRCISWIRSNILESNVDIKDISGQYTALCLMGPLSKLVLSEVLADPSELNTFPFFTYKQLAIGLASEVRVCNLTHTGELGWVLYIPNEYAMHVYDLLWRIGQRYDMRHAGSIAMRTLRIEKFFAFWGQDLDTTTTPFECGRSFRVKFDKDFLGKSALLKQKEEGVRRRYVQLLLDEFDEHNPIWPWGGEPIFICDSQYDNNVPVGLTTTTGYGFTLNRHVCLGFIRHPLNEVISNDFILKSRFEVEIGGKRYKARTNIHSPKLTDVSGTYLATRSGPE
ncbi:pyruvate dehydrogenase phosphatase regulatory subunit, mitochondrial-like [Oppia nitens]|uniref:pyruvate dehydrogenase phosphatase regulatory subunit, mitochondrial-like n=1 Tax=Oppia nitens TaxID=1686743 RepID=UPI0023DA0D8F|nr:pyruvate dehydrogenase phosphatase regulatory subunit, mitochondrial-like [Oppia nitens]